MVGIAIPLIFKNNEPTPTPDVERFTYPVQVQVKGSNERLPDAKITIEVAQKAPLDEITDTNGFARIHIAKSYEGQPARLIVEANGFKRYNQSIDLREGSLPDIIQLEKISTPSMSTKETIATPIPAVEAQIENTSTRISTSTPIPSTNFFTIPLSNIANSSTEEGYVSPPLGQPMKLDGIPFDLPPGLNSVTTQAEPLPDFPLTLSLPLEPEIIAPQYVYLLINGGNMFSEYSGKTIGTIRLHFSNNKPFSVPLIAGHNIREWKTFGPETLDSTTSSEVKEVWHTKSTDPTTTTSPARFPCTVATEP